MPRRGGDEVPASADAPRAFIVAAVGVVEGKLLKIVEAKGPFAADPLRKSPGQRVHARRGYQAAG